MKTINKSDLYKALEFVSLNNSENVEFRDNCVVSFSKNIGMYYPIDNSLIGTSKLERLKLALKFSDNFAITQLEENIQVKIEDLQVYVECPQVSIAFTTHESVLDLSAGFSEAISNLYKIPLKKSDKLSYTTLLNDCGTIYATNGTLIFGIYHGQNLPYFLIPGDISKICKKSKLRITGIGGDPNSFSLIFENGAVVSSNYPGLSWNKHPNDFISGFEESKPFPKECNVGISKIMKFCDKVIHFTEEHIASEDKDKAGAIIKNESGIIGSYPTKELSLILPAINRFVQYDDRLVFWGSIGDLPCCGALVRFGDQ